MSIVLKLKKKRFKKKKKKKRFIIREMETNSFDIPFDILFLTHETGKNPKL